MRINHKVLSIPPYLSTSWKNIVSLTTTVRESIVFLQVSLSNGNVLEIPDLQPAIIDAIFSAHTSYYENEPSATLLPRLNPPAQDPLFPPIGFSLKGGISGLDGFGSMLQHNQAQYNSPNLPQEILGKITSLTRAMGIADLSNLPKAEPHCNCPHCQIAKAIHQGTSEENESLSALTMNAEEEEAVADEELQFRNWDIEPIEKDLYKVSNPFDKQEYFNVFLGAPVGCTCGSKNCEHIRAVLHS